MDTTNKIKRQIEEEMKAVRTKYPDVTAQELGHVRGFLMLGALIGSRVIQQAWIKDTERTVAKIKTLLPDKT